MARAIAAHGWVAYNIEYRRVGRLGGGGWPATFDDVAGLRSTRSPRSRASISSASSPAVTRPAVISPCGPACAGAAPTACRPRRAARPVHTAISLAGVVDLTAAARRRVGGDAVVDLMGGAPDEVPERYAHGSPAELAPTGTTRQLLLHGLDDTTVPPTLSEDYAELMEARGADVRYVPLPGVAHLEMIDPGGAAFTRVLARLDQIAPPRPR